MEAFTSYYRDGHGLPYGDAGAVAMNGDWRPTVAVFSRMLAAPLEE